MTIEQILEDNSDLLSRLVTSSTVLLSKYNLSNATTINTLQGLSHEIYEIVNKNPTLDYQAELNGLLETARLKLPEKDYLRIYREFIDF